MPLFLLSFAVLVALLVGHTIGIADNLYLSIKVYDIFAHIMGGLGIGLFLAGLLHCHNQLSYKKRATLIILGVFVAGFVWEVFEVYFNIAGYPFGTKLYFLDTIKDLIDDVIGGFIALGIEHLIYRNDRG